MHTQCIHRPKHFLHLGSRAQRNGNQTNPTSPIAKYLMLHDLRRSHGYGLRIALVLAGGFYMKYFGAWLLGVPTGLIVLWFLFNHVH